MRTNRLRTALAGGEVVFGTMIQEARSPAAALILANAGYDFVFVDLEHAGACSPAQRRRRTTGSMKVK